MCAENGTWKCEKSREIIRQQKKCREKRGGIKNNLTSSRYRRLTTCASLTFSPEGERKAIHTFFWVPRRHFVKRFTLAVRWWEKWTASTSNKQNSHWKRGIFFSCYVESMRSSVHTFFDVNLWHRDENLRLGWTTPSQQSQPAVGRLIKVERERKKWKMTQLDGNGGASDEDRRKYVPTSCNVHNSIFQLAIQCWSSSSSVLGGERIYRHQINLWLQFLKCFLWLFFHIGTAFIHGCCAVDGIEVDFFILYIFFREG